MATGATRFDFATMDTNFNRFASLLEGDSFEELKTAFTKTGRGRKKDLKVDIKNKVFLQMNILKETTGKTWAETGNFLSRYTGETPDRLIGQIASCSKTFSSISLGTLEEAAAFIDQDVDLNKLEPFCQSAGITRTSLMDTAVPLERKDCVLNGLVIELEHYRSKQQLPFRQLHSWVCQTTGSDILQSRLKKLVDKTMATYRKLRSNSGKVGGSAAIDLFKETPFTIPVPQCPATQDCQQSQSTSPQAALNLALAKTGCELSASRRTIQELQAEVADLTAKNVVLTDEGNHKSSLINKQQHCQCQHGIHDLQSRLDIAVNTARDLKKENKLLTKQKKQYEKTISSLKAENIARRFKRLQVKYTNLQQMYQHNLKRKGELMHRKLRRTEVNKEAARRDCKTLSRELQELRMHVAELEQLAAERRVIRLKDPETGYFLQSAKVCMMEMVGQHEIAAARCGHIIETVCRHIVNADVPEDDLPSARSVGRFVDVGHVLGKLHITDAMMKSDHFDLHADGTTKAGQKIVGHQVTLDSGQSLSCGFTVVGTENANSLVDVAVGVLEELSLVFEDDVSKGHDVFLDLLQRMSALMSDRAAVMKSYNKELNLLRKDLLQTEEDLAFLHCNAHFLLGLVRGVEKALDQPRQDMQPLGREAVAKFVGSNRGELAVCRLVREACACLGPRGDERFGCRENWLAFCMLNERSSQLTSFKANRFNNLFQASAALHFHRTDVLDFAHNYMSSLNWKQEGIAADLQCDILDNHLVALGLMYFRLTEPYWRLLGRDVRYLDFYAYVVQMKQFLERWAEDPADAFAVEFEPLFGIDMGCASNDIFKSLVHIADNRQQAVQADLKLMSAAFLDVVNSQLSDFLPGPSPGKYYAVQDEKLRNRLKSSKLTNIIGEQVFGDLDFSVFKRRNASSHHHSSVNLLKRNKTISDWFSALPEEEQAAAMSKASSKANSLRKKHLQEELHAKEVRQQTLQENRERKIAAENKRRLRKADILERLRPHHGPCRTAADVSRLLRRYHSAKEQQDALKAEVLHHSTTRSSWAFLHLC